MVMPFDFLKVRPWDGIGIVDAQVGKIVVRHVFGGAARSHGSGILEHGDVGGGEGGGGDLGEVGGG